MVLEIECWWVLKGFEKGLCTRLCIRAMNEEFDGRLRTRVGLNEIQ